MTPLDDREPARPSVPVLTHAGDLLARYDVMFCDVWGVVHNGQSPYDAACAALQRFRAEGGTVVLVSNAPVPRAQVERMLGERRVPREAWDAIVSSGDIALQHVHSRGYRRLHMIGPAQRDSALFRELPGPSAAIGEAEAIVCTGLVDDRTETAEDYLPLLETARRHELPFVCANPDLVVDVGGRLYVCAGAIAELYAAMGGEVFWAGKPHASAYEMALATAERLRDAPVVRERIIAVGDAVRTDLVGAQRAGIDAIFVAAGIHREAVFDAERLCPEKIAELLAEPGSPTPRAAMAELAW